MVAGLPANFAACVCVVLHVPANAKSVLPRILSRVGRLEALHPVDGQALGPGQILVAPPDRHLLMESGRVRVTRGPREHGYRPSVDALFRSAAQSYGPRVIGVVLSGTLSDGTVGLQDIKSHGGLAIVQHPENALYANMPRSAIENVDVDHILDAQAIGPLLADLVRTSPPTQPPIDHEGLQVMGMHMERGNNDAELHGAKPSAFVCPDCQGTLFEIQRGSLVRYRCRVGHAYTLDSLLDVKSQDLERALWVALRTLDEKTDLVQELASRARARGQKRSVEHFTEQAAITAQHASLIREVLEPAESKDIPSPNGEDTELPGERSA